MTNFLAACLPALRLVAQPLRWSYRALRTLPLGRSPTWRFISGQFYMHIDPADWMDRAFYLGSYEQHLVRLIATTVRPGEVCIDVGAQKGFITLHLATAVGPAGRVIAFEPDPRAMEILKANVSRNGFQQIALHACALADREDACEFALSDQLGWSSRFPNPLAAPTIASTVSVKTRRLDNVLAESAIEPATHPISFIKIDAEGSEPLVLQGAQDTLRRFRPTVHIEVNKPSLRAGGSSADSIETLLRQLDYQLYAVRWRRTRRLQRQLHLAQISSLGAGIGDTADVVAISSANRSGANQPLREAIAQRRFRTE